MVQLNIEEKTTLEVGEIILLCGKELKWDFIYQTPEGDGFEFSNKSSIWSWGEIIFINIKQEGGIINVKVESKSKSQLIDWGTNSSNENDIIELIKKKINIKDETSS